MKKEKKTETILKKNNLYIITTKTPNGNFHIIVDSKNVAVTSGFSDIDRLIREIPSELEYQNIEPAVKHEYQQNVEAYYSGDKTALDKIPRRTYGSDFQKKVWQAIASIPYGQTASYKQIAKEAGNAGAIRAAATICGKNRLPLLIPCHRVIKSDGTMGKYFYGPQVKRFLLDLEQH